VKLPPESRFPANPDPTSQPDAAENRGAYCLAPHETLELHELLAFHANRLIRQKEAVGKIRDPDLCALYHYSIAATERCVCELMDALRSRPHMP
jgi:hypothetical protein